MNLKEMIEFFQLDAEEMREIIANEGITGKTSCDHCPLAQYLQRETGLKVHVHHGGISFPNDNISVQGNFYPELSRFIHNFDSGKYPELLEEDSLDD